MARVYRTLRSAQLAQSSTERKSRETRELFQRGIIPRNELDDLEQQASQQRMDLEAARREVESTRAKGQGESRRIAEMDLVNVSVKYETLRVQLDGHTMRVPFVDIVVATPSLVGEQGSREPVQTDSRLGQGQALFGLASAEWLEVSAKASELDINQLRGGQAVRISGGDFEGTTLAGVVAALDDQALPGMTQGGSPQFGVTVSVAPLDPCQLQKIRLGVSAKLAVTTYRDEQAIVAPPEAIRHKGDRLFADLRQAPGISVTAQQVKIGRSTPEGAEVFRLQPDLVCVLSSSD